MRLVNLNNDPNIFKSSFTSLKCDFITKYSQEFTQMHKSQGSTFWLRFLVSFKNHIEETIGKTEKWLAFMQNNIQFIKVVNIMCINLHKKFIECTRTALKKFIQNLSIIASNSPICLMYSFEEWLMYIQSSKQLHNIFQNILSVPETTENTRIVAFIFTVYTKFFGALGMVFKQWYKAKDLTNDEIKLLDSKIIYWLPNTDTVKKMKPFCFEKYISDHWKDNLPRMLLTDNIINSFRSHESSGCCEKLDIKTMCKLQLSKKHVLQLMNLLYNQVETDDSEETIKTICEKKLEYICTIKPEAVLCTSHAKCYVKIYHTDSCIEPFVCEGKNELCSLSCETEIKSNRKEDLTEKELETFWKKISVEVYPIDHTKRDVCTSAESFKKDMYRYLHIKDEFNVNMPLSTFRNTYPSLIETCRLDKNPRKTKYLTKLRNKIDDREASTSQTLEPRKIETLFENATTKMVQYQEMYCTSKGHNILKCLTSCFIRSRNTTANSTSNAFGRVVLLSKTIITIPYEPSCDRIRSDVKKPEANINDNRVHTSIATNDNTEEDSDNDVEKMIKLISSFECQTSVDITKNDSSDDDIDKILELINCDEKEHKMFTDANMKVEKAHRNAGNFSPKDDKAVENMSEEKRIPVTGTEEDAKMNLKFCAYCKKKEIQKKQFKKCSVCKEEKFPVQHYYCSRECLFEDWEKTHGEEHFRYHNS